MSNDFSVGYGKPPPGHKFKPGLSGNPKGRPKGTKNLKTDLIEELKELITIKESGVPKKVSKRRAMIKAMTAKAVQGDAKSANVVLGLIMKLLEVDGPPVDSMALAESDKTILDNFKKSILAREKGIAKKISLINRGAK